MPKAIKLAKPINLSGTIDLKKGCNPGNIQGEKMPGMSGKIDLKKMPRGF